MSIRKVPVLLALLVSLQVTAQQFVCNDKAVEKAFNLAVKIVDDNTRNGILAAGADYGGEWTRDISINSWNAASLLRPLVARESLWSVTVDRDTIGHQYWDKILWVTAAWNHFLVTGDRAFLENAYACSAKTIEGLERYAFDRKYQLFTGPSVFNDGIAGYPEPVFEPGNKSSYVLDHHGASTIKCLSTNCIYYGAYISLQQMASAVKEKAAIIRQYGAKAAQLKNAIRKNFYDATHNRFNYLVDQEGKTDASQEALGISFAVIFGIVDRQEAQKVIAKAKVSSYGIPSIYPDFPRYSHERPGRHNNIVWPMVNGFFARAARISGNDGVFTTEWMNLSRLALDPDKGNGDFKEIYNPYTGVPDGGWQGNGSEAEAHWKSCNAQTWSATAYISMVTNGLLGLSFAEDRLMLAPNMPGNIREMELNDLAWRDAVLSIKVSGTGRMITSFTVDGRKSTNHFVPGSLKGKHTIQITLK